MGKNSSAADFLSNLGTSYLTLVQVHDWIVYRKLENLEKRTSSNYVFHDEIVRNLQEVITWNAAVKYLSVEALLQLLKALEAGRVRATGTRNGMGSPRSLPAHFWHHLTFKNRSFGSRWEACAYFKTENFRGGFWSDLRFNAKGVLAVWPPFASPTHNGHDVEGDGSRALQSKLRPAPDSRIHKTICEVYDDAERAGLKPPNLKEIVAPVQNKLSAKGYVATGRRIQQLAESDAYKCRRRKPGVTVASEKRRQCS
jgi:hypothetical protein